MRVRTGLIVAALAGLWAGPSLACEPLVAVINAFNDSDEAAAAQAVDALGEASCSPEDRVMTGRIAALLAFNRITTAVSAGAALEDHAAELEALKARFGGPWQVLDALGDLYRGRRAYAEAARWYQAALEDSDNTRLTPQWMAPDSDYIAHIDHLATEMRLAAPEPVAFSQRGGCKTSYRGVALKRKTTPVRFVFGTADFTPQGEQSAADLAECLKSAAPSALTLTGHTDPIGTAEANRALSLERARALGAYLARAGFAGPIRVEGKGEDEPFVPDDADAYDAETLNQLNRRVDADLEK